MNMRKNYTFVTCASKATREFYAEAFGIEKEKKSVIKKLHELNIPIEQIAKVVELKEEEVKEILNDKKA